MSASAQGNFQSIMGNTARALTSFAPDARPARQGRSPLSLVVSAPRKRRAPFVVFCFLALVAALATVLVLNISVSSGQYQLVELRAAQLELQKTNQDLTQQVQNAQAPQNLVAKAAELGMVTSSSTGQINLDTMAVTGKPAAAVAGDKPLTVIAPPAVTGQQEESKTTGAAAAPAASEPVAPGGPSKAGTAAAGTAGTAAQDLNGGTIPAPKQKNG
ncbi:hypothetical protein [Paenarthrobacter sp. PH39-S1]|uniref:hypothetical protein n=1 Tax=Paenarthrobacter sp. PH39-S1 TaxID=3046204 RepID=UPI0024B8CB95|nr:hypothetical protein [Paenarthrobacter sp. PH39-S1]MDJ0356949.1 hypothetical protein [Paenarthrobacter sp. PH39-S1]